jgi:signal-transduction protein with cAMP-binding, CBS, and nucleotidyltransferase domain
MKSSGNSVIPVCDRGKYRGVITERAITDCIALAADPATEMAGQVMERTHPVIPPGADMFEAARVMANRGVRNLPVVQNGRLLGMLGLEDIARESMALAAMVFSRVVLSTRSQEVRV